jgi:hypothetical protein
MTSKENGIDLSSSLSEPMSAEDLAKYDANLRKHQTLVERAKETARFVDALMPFSTSFYLRGSYPGPRRPRLTLGASPQEKAGLMVNALNAALEDQYKAWKAPESLTMPEIHTLSKRHDALVEIDIAPHAWARVRVAFQVSEGTTDKKVFPRTKISFWTVYPERLTKQQIAQVRKMETHFFTCSKPPVSANEWHLQWYDMKSLLVASLLRQQDNGELLDDDMKERVKLYLASVDGLGTPDKKGTFPSSKESCIARAKMIEGEYMLELARRAELVRNGRWGW